jgi:peptidoglycan/LPS O-acetylase OafA/YrhL
VDIAASNLCMGMTSDTADGQVAGSAGRRGDIQGLRAVAVLLVVIYHADLGLSGGFVGVDVFFVISGYVITRMLTTELGRTNRVSLGRFYLRRIRRLLPALGLMLTVVMLASSLLSPIGGQQITARTGAAAALFNANTYLIRFGGAGYFDVDANVNALLHTWSLAVEEQFYFVFPATLFAAWALGRRVTRLGTGATVAVSLGLISGLSFFLSWMLTAGRSSF